MDGDAQAAHSICMDVAAAVRARERNQLIIDGIAELAYQPAPTNSPSSSMMDATEQTRTGESLGAGAVSLAAPATGSLKDASINRLACLLRHWTWADEAMKHFERQLVDGWDYEEDPLADHPFGAYYHWCALLCSFSEAALERGLLSKLQLETLRPELEASLPGLQACRQLLVAIPESLEEHPRIVDLLRDSQTIGRLRRIHHALGEALRKEQMSRALDWLLYEH